MARKKNTPILTHTGLLCLAYRALEQDVRQWEEALSKVPSEEPQRDLEHICAVQLSQMEAIRHMYFYETGSEL